MYIIETTFKNKLTGGLSLGLWVLFLRIGYRSVCNQSYSVYSHLSVFKKGNLSPVIATKCSVGGGTGPYNEGK